MRIVGLTMARVPLSLVSALRTSTGTHASRTAALVEVTLDDGAVGWGENVAPEGDFYTGETAATSLAAMRTVLAPLLADRRFESPHEMDATWWGTDSWPMARCAIESAAWDAWARSRGVAFAAALGGEPGRVAVGAVVGLHDDIAATVEEALARVHEGYRHLKVKIAPGHDNDVIAALRDAVGSKVSISVDANGSFGSSDIDRLASLADLGVTVVEQPFAPDDLALSKTLRETGTVRVGLDESVCGLDDLDRALGAGAIDALNVKPSRLGGFGVARAALERCRAEGIDAWIGGMLESGIGRAGALALSTHPACTLPPDLSASSRYFEVDVTEQFALTEGFLVVPDLPGIGRTPDARAMGLATIETIL